MKKYSRLAFFIALSFPVLMCNDKDNGKAEGESVFKGTASVLVDETLMPIMEDQVAVFESEYEAKIKLMPRSETEAIQALFKDSAAIVIMARPLSEKELKLLAQKKITPGVTKFATDAIALITNKSQGDTLIALRDVLDFIKGKGQQNISGLVFDNPNSSTVAYLSTMAGVTSVPEKGIFSFKTNEEVIKFVAENRGMIGVVGINWLLQPSVEVEKYSADVHILSVKGLTGTDYQYPSQNSLAEGKYPLARDLYIVNAQKFSGLGTGFGSFLTGERGQRIILKSGLLPIKIPARKIVTRNEIEKKNNLN